MTTMTVTMAGWWHESDKGLMSLISQILCWLKQSCQKRKKEVDKWVANLLEASVEEVRRSAYQTPVPLLALLIGLNDSPMIVDWLQKRDRRLSTALRTVCPHDFIMILEWSVIIRCHPNLEAINNVDLEATIIKWWWWNFSVIPLVWSST